ncbi:hypothetical protein QTP70_012071 [Hemibagrus guttatus]|uniref:CCHC-type domain-containing protein n=1 Tax=Hemibagrus guttatus TaxID=175788 RepID=A0AAE0QQ89_9TELE|nr:hypothetical protein QTP70_012071 [Hemibagrus guttatus]
MLDMELPGRRQRGRPKRSFLTSRSVNPSSLAHQHLGRNINPTKLPDPQDMEIQNTMRESEKAMRGPKRMVYMVFKEGTEELNVVVKFSVDGFDYNIFVSSDADIKCFKCGKTGHLVRACPERQSDPGVSERPGQEAAEPAVVIPPAATVWPAAESPGVADAPEQTESEPQAQPAAQKPTGATLTPEEPCVAEPVTVKSCSTELVSVRHGGTDRDQEKPCLTEPDLERPCSVDSGAVLELPALAEAGTEVQSCRLEAPVTTPVQEDGGDVEMEDEPTFKVPTKRKKKAMQWRG